MYEISSLDNTHHFFQAPSSPVVIITFFINPTWGVSASEAAVEASVFQGFAWRWMEKHMAMVVSIGWWTKSLHRKWLEITKHPFFYGCLGFREQKSCEKCHGFHYIRCIWGWLLRIPSPMYHHFPYDSTSWWLNQPIWKICAPSNWIMKHQSSGWK